MGRSLDEVLHELSVIQDELLAAPENDFARRAALHQRREELRAEAVEARAAIGDEPTADQLEQLIRHLEAEIRRHLEARPAASAAAQTGLGGGIDPGYLQEMQQKMATSFGLDDKRAELQRLKVRLSELRED